MQGTTLRAGAGRADITATAGDLSYGLYPAKAMVHIPPQYREQRVAIHDPLYARALVLDDGGEKLVLVTMDCCAIGARTTSQYILYDSADDFLPRLRQRVEAELGIPGDRVSVSASHTHPPGRLLCDDDEQIARTFEAIAAAVRQLAPVTLGVGAAHNDTLTLNRTMVMKDGTDYSWLPEPPGEEVERLRPIDPAIAIVRIDRLDGTPLAVLYDFASHLLSSHDGKLTADFPGVTSRYLEDRLGGGVTAMFLQGANGDIVDASYHDRGIPRSMEEFGYALGRSILEAWPGIATGPATLAVATRQVALPMRTDIPACVAEVRRQQAELVTSMRYTRLSFKTFLPLYLQYALHPDFPGHLPQRYMAADACGDPTLRVADAQNRVYVAKYLQSIRAMEWMAINELKIGTLVKHQEIIDELGGSTVAAEIKGMRLGDGVFIAAPLEFLAEVGFSVKRTSPFAHTYLISDANGYLHYAAPASYYGRGGYEVTECLLAPEWEAVFMAAVREILEELRG